MSGERIERLFAGGLLAAFAGFLVYLRPYGLILNDEGWYLYPALRMLEGDVLYQDVFTYYAPLRYHLLEAVFAIGQPSILLARSVWLILIVISVAGIYSIARRFAPPAVAWLPATAYGLAPGPWHKSPYGLCTVAFLLALARTFERPTKVRLLLLGVAAGVSMLTRQELGLAQLLMSCALVGALPALEARTLGLATLRAGARQAVLVALGAVVTVAPVLVYYASLGALGALVDAVLLQAYEYSSDAPASLLDLLRPATFTHAIEGSRVGAALLLALLAYPIALGLLWREIRARRLGVPTLLGLAVLIHAAPSLVQGYYPLLLVRFLQSAIPLYLLGAWILGRLGERSRRLAVAATAILLAAFLGGVWGGFPTVHPSDSYTGSARMLGYSVPVDILGDTVFTDQETADGIRLARAFFTERTSPTETVFTAPLLSLYYVLLDRRNPTRFLGDIGNRAMSAGRKRVEIERLLASDTRYAVVERGWWSKPPGPARPILAALVRNFRPVRDYGSIVILEREPDEARREIGEIHRRMLRGQSKPRDEAALRAIIRRKPAEPLPRELLERWADEASRLDLINERPLAGAKARPRERVAAASSPPSFVLFVTDTTRADSVSAYGAVSGTTPTLDALAQQGLLYRRAYAQAPWTLPSHATLFTGLLPSQHGVTWRRPRAPDALVMLAERLRDAGYDTFGVSENVWVAPAFNLAQGFAGFVRAGVRGRDTVRAVEQWWSHRSHDRPFFLFVNVIDAHWPYATTRDHRFLPAGTKPETARKLDQTLDGYMCSDPPPTTSLEILRGFYYGGVAAADAKLARVLEVLAEPSAGDTIVMVTSDHGEHFGERGLVSHQFSLAGALLHVPLVVHGLPGVVPAEIEEPVQLADVAPSMLAWAGLPVPQTVVGRPLPVIPRSSWPARVSIAEYHDPETARTETDNAATRQMRARGAALRAPCTPEWPVFGEMGAVTRYPFKLRWFDRYPSELYDLELDPGESRDLAAQRPQLVAELLAQLPQALPAQSSQSAEPEPAPSPSDEILDQLRALGYLGADD
jgi:arylsulfatase A-like enzyme